MKSDISPIRNWFGYTRRERRSSFILLLLIVFVISARFLIPEKNIPIENVPLEFEAEIAGPGSVEVLNGTGRTERKQAYQKKKSLVVNINRSDTSELIKLPGIGPVLSLRIVKYRQLLGGFARKDQLREVYGLPLETYDLIKDMVYVDTLLISKINVNVADYKMLSRLPYFERYEVTAIIKYRELEGRIRDIDELVDNKVITEDKALKVKPYLRFE